MAVWLVRAGKGGEYEEQFFADGRIYLQTGGKLAEDLSSRTSNELIRETLRQLHPDATTAKIAAWTGHIASFLMRMKRGDLVVTPRKNRGQYAVGQITGDYAYDNTRPVLFRHFRSVKWLNLEVPKASVDLDIQYALNLQASIVGVHRENADERILAATMGKGVPLAKAQDLQAVAEAATEDQPDLQSIAKTQIAQHIIRKFKGHRLAELVGAVLDAQGYTTFVSPPGADGGIDILAAPAPLGFGHPRLCVQVKSGDSPVDSPTVSQLIGAMQNAQAEQGLFVAWGGFKDSVIREIPRQFFRVRLWDQDDLVQQILDHYDKLNADLQAELPLKKIWSLALTDEEGDT